MQNKVLVIVGPTASGKTSTGFELAKKFGNPIISADSRAIYKSLDIGAAKPTIEAKKVRQYSDDAGLVVEIDDLKHYLINVADLSQNYTVKNWTDDALKIINYYHTKNITPIIVGGTGLYIEALLKGYQFPQITNNLREEIKNLSHEEKLEKLKTLDPQTYNKIDRQNPVRIDRALTYVLSTGQSFSKAQKSSPPSWQTKIIFIDHPRDILYSRIDKGLEKRFSMGMIGEIDNLLKQGLREKLNILGLEYRFVAKYLDGELELKEMQEKLKFAIHAFARRQLTWWRKREGVLYVGSPEEAYAEGAQFLE